MSLLPAGSLRPLFWAHLTTDSDGNSSILCSQTPLLSSETQGDDSDISSRSSIEERSSSRTTSMVSSTELTEVSEIRSLPESEDAERPIRVKLRSVPRKRKPALRRCCSPTMESLRDIRQRQSEEDLRHLYEAQTLAYLNGTIQF